MKQMTDLIKAIMKATLEIWVKVPVNRASNQIKLTKEYVKLTQTKLDATVQLTEEKKLKACINSS